MPMSSTQISSQRQILATVRAMEASAVVHQDLGLVDEASVVDNIAVGSGFDSRLLGAIRTRKLVDKCVPEDRHRITALAYLPQPVTDDQYGDIGGS
jgi:ABC-type sugar transport system ATPase subunit